MDDLNGRATVVMLWFRLRRVLGLAVGVVLALLGGGGPSTDEVDRRLDRRFLLRSAFDARSPTTRRFCERAGVDVLRAYIGVRCTLETGESDRGAIVVANGQRFVCDRVRDHEWTLAAPGLAGVRIIVL